MTRFPILAVLAAAVSLVSLSAHSAGGFALTSPDLKDQQPIKAEQYANTFGCTGTGNSPVLEWKNAPAGTQGFAVTFYDRDAPTGSGFWHWVVYDIPTDVTRLDAGKVPAGAVEGNTDVGKPGYVGACPPLGRKHRYVYAVHALKSAKLDIPAGATAAYAGFVIYSQTISKATLAVTAGPRKQ